MFRATFLNRVRGVPLFLKDLNCHCIDPTKGLALDSAAWSNPADGQWGTSAPYYNDYRCSPYCALRGGVVPVVAIRRLVVAMDKDLGLDYTDGANRSVLFSRGLARLLKKNTEYEGPDFSGQQKTAVAGGFLLAPRSAPTL